MAGEDKKKNKELYGFLSNNDKVYVLLPALGTLSVNFSKEIQKFIDVIDNNQIIREILTDESTLMDFFTEEGTTSDPSTESPQPIP